MNVYLDDTTLVAIRAAKLAAKSGQARPFKHGPLPSTRRGTSRPAVPIPRG
jgi:hypothetical protein